MSTPATNPIPHGMHSLTPHLVCDGAAAAIAFYEKAFGAVELFRLPTPDGRLMHAMVRIGDSPLMLVDHFEQMGALAPSGPGAARVTLHLSVPDVDATVQRALAAGATLRLPVADMFWGARYGVVQDPFGHQWSVATQVRDLSPEEIGAAMTTQAPADCPGA